MLPRKHHRTFQTIAQSLGFKGARLHDIRHAHATILLEQGVHPKIVQERLGHSSVLTTLDIYSHIVPSLQQVAARKIDEDLEGALAEDQTEVHQENVGNLALNDYFEVEFEARRGVRVVYGDGLENRCLRKGTVGSNPTPSAIL